VQTCALPICKRDGVFYEPTILTNVHDDMKVSCEEVFGPVVGVRKYSDLDGCIRSINQSKYGLQAGIFTRNLNTAFHAARKIHVRSEEHTSGLQSRENIVC